MGGAVLPSNEVLFPSSFPRAESAAFFTILGGINSAFGVGKNVDNFQRQINLVNNLSWVVNTHELKFGIDYRRLSPIYDPLKYFHASVFSNAANAILGRAQSVSIRADSDARFILFNNFSAYAQDTWRWTRRFTLTFGLRWEHNPPPTEIRGNDPFTVTGLDNPATLTLATRDMPLWQTTYTNFAPRVGLAYHLLQRGNKETVLRGGFVIFYDLGNGLASQAFTSVFPYTASKTLSNVSYPLNAAQAAPPPFGTNPPVSQIYVFDSNLKLPRTYQWNLGVEQSVGANQTVSATYVAALGRQLIREEQLVNPNPTFQQVFVARNAATSDYHALQLHFNTSGGCRTACRL